MEDGELQPNPRAGIKIERVKVPQHRPWPKRGAWTLGVPKLVHILQTGLLLAIDTYSTRETQTDSPGFLVAATIATYGGVCKPEDAHTYGIPASMWSI